MNRCQGNPVASLTLMCPLLQVMTSQPTWQVYAGHSKSRLLVVKPDMMQGQKSVSVFLESNPQKDFVSAADFSVRSDMGAHNMWIYARNQCRIAEVCTCAI